jgi:putative DNA primase/helicase
MNTYKNDVAEQQAWLDSLLPIECATIRGKVPTRNRTDDAITVDLVRGDTIKLEAVKWIWKNTLPQGMLTILAGAPGCGKTTIAISLGATISSGGNWPDKTACQFAGDVVIWSGEDSEGILAARFKACGADMARVHFVGDLANGQKVSFDPAKHMPLLETALVGLQAPRLLILDPVVSAIDGDSYKATEVRRGLQPVVNLASRVGCAVLGITHFSKGTAGRDVVERINGSMAFGAVARVVLVAAKVQDSENPEETKRIFMRAKSNIGPDDGGFEYELDRIELEPDIEGQCVVWGQRIEGSARDALAEGEPQSDGPTKGADNENQSDAEGFLRVVLAAGPMAAKDIQEQAKQAGIPYRTVQHWRGKLGVETRKMGKEQGWHWLPPCAWGEGATKSANAQKAQRANDGESVASSVDDECNPIAKVQDSSAFLHVAPFAPSCAFGKTIAPSTDETESI